MKSMPSRSSVEPKGETRRAGVDPCRSAPAAAEADHAERLEQGALGRELEASAIDEIRPSISDKYFAGPKASATAVSGVTTTAIRMVVTVPLSAF